MASAEPVLTSEGTGEEKRKPLRIGIEVLTTTMVAERANVSSRTVERWITKPRNALPALRVTAEQMRSMGAGNLYPSPTGFYFLVKVADLSLIPSIRKYPKGTKRPNRTRKGTTTGAGAPDRQP